MLSWRIIEGLHKTHVTKIRREKKKFSRTGRLLLPIKALFVLAAFNLYPKWLTGIFYRKGIKCVRWARSFLTEGTKLGLATQLMIWSQKIMLSSSYSLKQRALLKQEANTNKLVFIFVMLEKTCPFYLNSSYSFEPILKAFPGFNPLFPFYIPG